MRAYQELETAACPCFLLQRQGKAVSLAGVRVGETNRLQPWLPGVAKEELPGLVCQRCQEQPASKRTASVARNTAAKGWPVLPGAPSNTGDRTALPHHKPYSGVANHAPQRGAVKVDQVGLVSREARDRQQRG